jgi:tRNA G18 (ribose-2'-O)-methylase SpoU
LTAPPAGVHGAGTVTEPLTKPELRRRKPSREGFAGLPRLPVVLLLDSLKCAHNIGTLLRLADGLMLEKVWICGDTIVPPNGKIRSSSRGAERWVPWEYAYSAMEVGRRLKDARWNIIAAELSADSIPYREARYEAPLCLVLGREYDGVSPDLLALADQVVELPLYGMANSLNVSVVAGVILYEAVHRLRGPVSTCRSSPPATAAPAA